MNDLWSLIDGGLDRRTRHQVGALQHRMDILVSGVVSSAAKRAGIQWTGAVNNEQRGHVHADQLLRLHPNEVCQRPVYTQNDSRLVVSHDEVADGIENFGPVPI